MKRFWLTTIFTLHALFSPFLALNVFSDATLPYETMAEVANDDHAAFATCPASTEE